MDEKYCIIHGDIYKLVRIKENEKWPQYLSRFHEKDDWYWVPVKDWKANHSLGHWYWRPYFDA